MDSYGIPVSLTYKNEPCITSVLGGVATIIARLLVLTYLLVKCKSVFDQEYTLQTSFSKTDLTTDPTISNITRDKFDFGIKVDYLQKDIDPETFKNLDDYVQL